MTQPPNTSPPAPSRRPLLAVCALLFLATFALFAPAVHNGFLDYDDPGYITHNLHIQRGFTFPALRWAFTTGYAANYHPLTWLSHTLDWNLFGPDPRGHHATSILFHSLSAVMVFLTFRKLTGSFWTSAFAAAIFALHPLRVESVAWISERKDVLSLFFGLLTIYAYAIYAHRRHDHRPAFFPYIAAFFFLAVGLLCKPTLVTIPCLLLVLDYWPLRRSPSQPEANCPIWPLIFEKIPLFLLAAASSAITYHVQKAGGAMMETIPLSHRLINAAVSVLRYLGKFFWPFNLAVCYPYPRQWPPMLVAASVILILLITALALSQRKVRPWILVGWLWYLGTLVPVVGIVQVGLQSLADRYTYLPLLGIELALLWTLRQIPWPTKSKWLKPTAAILILLALSACTRNQLSDWQTPQKLYEHALSVTDDNYLAECFLGSVYFGQNQFDQAGQHFQRAIDFKPDYAVAQYRLGLVLDKQGNHAAAMTQYQKVLTLNPDDPMAHFSLGVDLLTRNQPAAAIPDFQIALNDRDDFNRASTYLAMGMAYARMNNPAKAIDSYQQSIDLNPTSAEAHYDNANALSAQDQNDQAIHEYETAIKLNPNFPEALRNEANLLRKMNRPAEAAARYQEAIALDPQNPTAYFGLGSALEDMQKPQAAAAAYEQAIAIQPTYADAQFNLGVLYLNAGHPDTAMPHFWSAAGAQPTNAPAFLGLGICQDELGNHTAAEKSLRCSIALDPTNPDTHYYLANTLNSMGQATEAIDEWNQTLRLSPNYPGVADLIAKARASLAAPAATKP